MSKDNNGNAVNPVVEEAIRNTLNGDALRNALSFIAFMKENGITCEPAEGIWVYEDGCVLYMDGAANMPGPWTIWAEFGTDDDGDSVDGRLKEVAWAHINPCGNCGCGNQPGSRKTVFGREFDHICTSTLVFHNPDAGTLESIKQLALLKKRA